MKIDEGWRTSLVQIKRKEYPSEEPSSSRWFFFKNPSLFTGNLHTGLSDSTTTASSYYSSDRGERLRQWYQRGSLLPTEHGDPIDPACLLVEIRNRQTVSFVRQQRGEKWLDRNEWNQSRTRSSRLEHGHPNPVSNWSTKRIPDDCQSTGGWTKQGHLQLRSRVTWSNRSGGVSTTSGRYRSGNSTTFNLHSAHCSYRTTCTGWCKILMWLLWRKQLFSCQLVNPILTECSWCFIEVDKDSELGVIRYLWIRWHHVCNITST